MFLIFYPCRIYNYSAKFYLYLLRYRRIIYIFIIYIEWAYLKTKLHLIKFLLLSFKRQCTVLIKIYIIDKEF